MPSICGLLISHVSLCTCLNYYLLKGVVAWPNNSFIKLQLGWTFLLRSICVKNDFILHVWMRVKGIGLDHSHPLWDFFVCPFCYVMNKSLTREEILLLSLFVLIASHSCSMSLRSSQAFEITLCILTELSGQWGVFVRRRISLIFLASSYCSYVADEWLFTDFKAKIQPHPVFGS